MARHPSDYFTFPGRVLSLLTLVIAVGGPFAYFAWVMDDLPPGRRYPLWFFALPVLTGAGLFFAACSALLKAIGVEVFKDPDAS